MTNETGETTATPSGDLMTIVRDMFEHRIAFNRLLGLKILSICGDEASSRLDMRDEFIGNYTRGIIHGGVISAALDATAGLVAYSAVATDTSEMTREERLDPVGASAGELPTGESKRKEEP